jgi:uncharacterized protein (DUF488 family)
MTNKTHGDGRRVRAGENRAKTPPRHLLTIGYEGRSLEDFVAVLLAERVTRVLDVRELPLSRRKGFSKTPLRDALSKAGIDYVHLRAAGNPYRDKKHDVELCLRLYRAHLERSPDVIDLVEESAVGHRVALLCVEHDPGCCHRSIIAAQLRRRRPAIIVRDL